MTQEKINDVLRDIYAKVPKEWRDNVVQTTPLTPTMASVVSKAIEDPDFPQEKKEQLKIFQDLGYFNKEKFAENSNLAKKIDTFVNREIKKAVKEGRLPTKKKLKELQEQWKQQKENLLKV